MPEELKSLAFTYAFPKGQRVSIMRDMMAGTMLGDNRRFIMGWNGRHFVEEDGSLWSFAAEIPAKKTVPLSDREIFGLGDVVFKLIHNGKPFTGWKSTRSAEHYEYMKRGDYANGCDLWIPMTKEVDE